MTRRRLLQSLAVALFAAPWLPKLARAAEVAIPKEPKRLVLFLNRRTGRMVAMEEGAYLMKKESPWVNFSARPRRPAEAEAVVMGEDFCVGDTLLEVGVAIQEDEP